jgi:integrase
MDDHGPDLVPAAGNAQLAAKLRRLAGLASGAAEQSLAPSTKASYASDWRDFSTWTGTHGFTVMPATPQAVALYLADLAAEAGAAMKTLERRLASISLAHRSAQLEDPTKAVLVEKTMSGLRRTYGRPQRKAAPITVERVRAMLAVAPPGIKGTRDRALILVGLAGGFRRSELVALEVSHLRHEPQGLRLRVARSKTDQGGLGEDVGIPYGAHGDTCPVLALDRWLQEARISEGRVFRSIDRHGNVGESLTPTSVNLIVKAYAEAAGLTKALRGEVSPLFTAHSLRAGFATSAALAGHGERDIQRHTRHSSTEVLRGYIRDAELYRGGDIGL